MRVAGACRWGSALTREAFVADGWRVRATWILAFATPVAVTWYATRAVVYTPPLSFLALGAALALSGTMVFLIWGLIQRSRPVVEVDDDELAAGSIYRFGARRRIPMREIAAVTVSGTRLRVTTRSGDVLSIAVAELSKASRKRVVDEITRRIRPAG